MTIKECYQAFGGNYEDVISRFRTEERIEKYIIKFLNDQSFQILKNSLADGCVEEAFRAAHTLKGVAQNLGFDRLAKSSDLITETLRIRDAVQAELLFSQLSEDYDLIMASIKEVHSKTDTK